MTLIFLRIDNQLQCFVSLTFITGTKDFMVTTQCTNNNQIETFICSPGSTHHPFIEPILKKAPPNHKSHNGKFWKNLVEASWRRSADNKKFLRVNLSCKCTPISLQGEHLISTIFWIADESNLHVRIRAIENRLAVMLVPISIQTEEFANIFVTLKISKKIGQRGKSKLGRSSEFYGHQSWWLHEVSHINLLHALVDLYDNWTHLLDLNERKNCRSIK